MRAHALLVLALVAVPLASAQPQPGAAPTIAVELSGLPAAFEAMASNASASAPFEVKVTMANVACPQGATIPVTITVTAKLPAAFFTAVATPAQLNVSVPGPAYLTTPFTGSAKGAVAATAGEVPVNATIPVEVVAAVAGLPAGCSGTGSAPAATSKAAVITAGLIAPPPPPQPTLEQGKSLPAPTAALVGLAWVAAAFARRRNAKP